MMRFQFQVRSGPTAGQSVELSAPEITIGRMTDNMICLDDPSVSHYHAQLDREGDGYLLEDLGSANGTFCNAQRITEPILLKPGDTVHIGTVELVFELATTAVEGTASAAGERTKEANPKSERRERSRVAWVVALAGTAVLYGVVAWYYHGWPFDDQGPLNKWARRGGDPLLADPDYQATQAAEAARDFASLLKHAQALVRRFPGDSQAYYILGVGYGEMQFYDDAVTAFQQAIKIKPDYAEAWDNLGWVYSRQNKFPEAIETFQQALKLRPGDARSWSNLAGANAALGRNADAIVAYRKSVGLKPDNADALFNLGVLYGAENKPVESVDSFRAAVKVKPDMVEAWFNLGVVSHRRNHDDEAVVFFQQALKLKPDYGDAWAGLVKAHIALQQFDKAGDAARELKKIDPAQAADLASELQRLTQ